jgi:predicted Zn-dependent protease
VPNVFPNHARSFGVLLLLAAACAAPRPPAPPPAPDAAAFAPEVVASPAPVDAASEVEAARAARDAGDRDTAREHLRRAIAADPTLYEPRLDLAELLLADAGGAQEAARLLDEAQALRRPDARLERLRGEALELLGAAAEAADAYARADALESDPDVTLRRAVLLRGLGRDAEAVAAFEAVRAARPGDRLARQSLADLYEASGRAADAERELTALARDAPADPAPLRRLAAFLRRRGDARRARIVEAEAARLAAQPRALRPLRRSSR